MNQYFIGPSESDPEKAFAIELNLNIAEGVSDLYFPYWRPGRYEPGNFVKWSRKFVVNGETKNVEVKKKKPNHWVIQSDIAQVIKVSYEWCFHELNAGSSFLSKELFYVNPVNLFCFLEQNNKEEIEVLIDTKSEWLYAGGIPAIKDQQTGKWKIKALDFDHLADSPFVFAPEIHLKNWNHQGVDFSIHSIGPLPKRWQDSSYEDLIQVSNFQQMVMKGFPVTDYHYIFIFTPHRMRHGVEHRNSTMIVMGQGEVSDDDYYDEVLSIASHELFHTWNVKYCRPKDLLPYDFTQSQYSDTGLITEGITTYYGDLMLWRSGVWTWEKMAKSIEDCLNSHIQNEGRFSSSLLDSSIDTWVDGYVKGTHRRKVSIYNEGALMAFLIDVWMLRCTNGKCSMDDVIRELSDRFNIHGNGYELKDYWTIIENLTGECTNKFQLMVNSPVEYTKEILEVLHWIGQPCRIKTTDQLSKCTLEALNHENKLSFLKRCP